MKIYLAGLLFVSALLPVFAFADNQPAEIKLCGTVKSVVAIGAETTGWALYLDFDTAVGGKIFKQMEIEPPKDVDMEKYKGARVEVTGTLKEKTGIERGKYSVLQVKTIKLITPP